MGKYLPGHVSANGAENSLSLLQHSHIGIYHHYMSDDHLHCYIMKHSFMHNGSDCHLIDEMTEVAAARYGRHLALAVTTPDIMRNLPNSLTEK